MGFFKDFKEFALKGNAIDMAVGIILGAAFNKVVSSLVNDIFMPPLGMMIGGVDFKDLKKVLKDASVAADGKATPEVAIAYGSFISTTIDFLLVALTVFFVVKLMNKMMSVRLPMVKRGEAAPVAAPEAKK